MEKFEINQRLKSLKKLLDKFVVVVIFPSLFNVYMGYVVLPFCKSRIRIFAREESFPDSEGRGRGQRRMLVRIWQKFYGLWILTVWVFFRKLSVVGSGERI